MRIPANQKRAGEAVFHGGTPGVPLVLALLLLWASPAFPERPPGLSGSPAPQHSAGAIDYPTPYQLGWADAGLSAGGALFGLFALHRYREMDPVPKGTADPSGLPSFD